MRDSAVQRLIARPRRSIMQKRGGFMSRGPSISSAFCARYSLSASLVFLVHSSCYFKLTLQITNLLFFGFDRSGKTRDVVISARK